MVDVDVIDLQLGGGMHAARPAKLVSRVVKIDKYGKQSR